MIKNKRVLITGVAGSIGSELARQLCKNNKVFGIDLNESGFFDIQQETGIFGRVGDIRDDKTCYDIFSDFKPQIVYHAAAYKHVPLMEKYPIEAIQTNVMGTWNVIKEAKNWECMEKFVLISTDKAVQSTSIMGATKRLGEILVKNQGKGFVVVRFGNVLGSRGSLIPIWQKQMDKGEMLTVTDERMERYFMTIQEACNLVIEAGELGQGGEIICLEMGKKYNIQKLAFDILDKCGKKPEVDIIGTRPGETLSEEIMFEEEKWRAKKEGKFIIIKNGI
jgi:FlaA1/EpsC-like NDP-sugar epimerase